MYQEQIYAVENAARKEIVDKLDINSPIILENSNGEEELLGLPCQRYINKYEEVVYYYITELYKDEEGYFAKGINFEDGSYEFDLFSEVDSNVLAEIADNL